MTTWRDSAAVAQHCADLLSGRDLGRVLDAGGGEGHLTAYLNRQAMRSAGRSLEAVVLDADADVLAQVPAPMVGMHGRIEELSQAAGRFSTILLRQVLHYTAAPGAALTVLAQRLARDGVIYVGQMVAPDDRHARRIGETTSWTSGARRRVWTAKALLETFTDAHLYVDRARLVPYSRATGSDVAWLHAVLRTDRPFG